jgi:transposase-like protein
MANEALPKTLQQAIQRFSDEQICVEFVAKLRWTKGIPTCYNCGSQDCMYQPKRLTWRCRECNKHFSVKVGTIFEDSPIPLHKWLAGFWLIASAKNGISSYEIHRALGITQKSAWHMMHRIRLAMQNGTIEKMGGEGESIEADETFIGGLSRNMHKDRRAKTIKGTGGAGKAVVFGLLERNTVSGRSKVRAQVVPNRWKETIQPIIKENVHAASNVHTDECLAYRDLGLTEEQYRHAFVAHAEAYVDGNVHTNGIENFWALLKRCIKGTYVSVEPFHLFRYLDEEAFRFNERFGTDQDRFMLALSGIVGRRVTYNQLTGKAEALTEGAAQA